MAKLKISDSSENEAAALLVRKARPVVSLPADDQKDSHTVSHKADSHELAGLSCALYGGPSDGLAAEMKSWRDIPKDATYESPFANHGPNPNMYVTFEPDEGGWNNIRMAMGTFQKQPWQWRMRWILITIFKNELLQWVESWFCLRFTAVITIVSTSTTSTGSSFG